MTAPEETPEAEATPVESEAVEAAQPAAPVSEKPRCIGCNRPMRRRGVLLKDEPETMAWGHSGKCKSCIQPNGPGDRKKNKPAVTVKTAPALADGGRDLRLEHTITGLESWNAARERRNEIRARRAAVLALEQARRIA